MSYTNAVGPNQGRVDKNQQILDQFFTNKVQGQKERLVVVKQGETRLEIRPTQSWRGRLFAKMSSCPPFTRKTEGKVTESFYKVVEFCKDKGISHKDLPKTIENYNKDMLKTLFLNSLQRVLRIYTTIR